MKLKATIVILLIFSFLLNVLLLFKLQKNLVLSPSKPKFIQHESDFQTVKSNQIQQFLNEDRTLPNITVTTVDDKTINLKDLVGEGPKLIFRYTELNCQMCVDSALLQLKAIGDEVGNDKIIVLASYYNKRDLLMFKKINDLPFKIYNLKENKLDFPLEKANKPFYFMLDETLNSKMFFIPEKTLPDLSKQYLNIIKERYLF